MARSPFPQPTRRSSPRTNGLVGGVVLVLIGVVWLSLLYAMVIGPDWRLNHDYVETRCVVLDKRLGEVGGDDADTPTSYRPEIHVRYTVDGREHQAWTYDAAGAYNNDSNVPQRTLDQFIVGQEYPLWYDPANPDKAVLVRSHSDAIYAIAAIPLLLILLGAVLACLALLGRPAAASAGVGDSTAIPARALAMFPGLADLAARLEHEGLNVGQALPAGPDPPDPAGRPRGIGPIAAPSLPTVPRSIFGEQPGAVLAVALRPGTPIPVAWAKAVVPLVLGVAVIVGAPLMSQSLGCGLAVALGVGGPLALFGGFKLLVESRVGPTAVEVSVHPLRPGEPFELCVTQAGPLRLRLLRVFVVCEESVAYRQGTDTRRETKCVCRQILVHEAGLKIGRDAPFEWRGVVALPEDVMHSFAAQHNQVRWKMLVHGEPAGLPSFDRDFPVVVAPAPAALPATGGPAS